MHLMNEALEAYSARFSEPESELLQALARETGQKVLHHRMLSGHLQGRILAGIARMLRPKRILEIGTYTGYSALCLAEGLAEGGALWTIDVNDEIQWLRDKYFAKSGMGGQIHQRIGDGLEWIQALDEPWDLVFVDADKERSPQYYDAIIGATRPGCWAIFDNVLWNGKVTTAPEEHDAETAAIHALNEKARLDERTRPILLPVRDGMLLLERL